MAPPKTKTQWDHQYNTLRREDLFRNPPKDHTAYPLLQIAVNPHIESFNALFPSDGRPGIIAHGLADIGTKVFYDSPDGSSANARNKLTIRYKSVHLQKSMLPPTNKFAKTREIFPAEARERHATYRGKLTATLEYRINDGDPYEFVRDLGNMPIMIKVGTCPVSNKSCRITFSQSNSRTSATWKTTPRLFLCNAKRSRRNWAATSS